MSVTNGIKKTVNQAVNLYKKYEDPITKVKDGIVAGYTVKGQAKDIYDAVKLVSKNGLKKATALMNKDAAQGIIDPVSRWSIMGKVSFAGNIVSTVTSAVSLPNVIGTAYKDIRTAAREGSFKSIADASVSTLDATVKTLSTVVDGSRIVQTAARMKASYTAAAKAFKAVAPQASKKLVAAAARSVMKSSLEGTAKTAAKGAVNAAAKKLIEKSGKSLAEGLLKTGEKAAAKAMLKAASKEAVKAGLEAGTKAAAGTAGKLVGRFTPGLNIAIAAYDTAMCVKTLADKNASTGAKVCSVITAAGSILGATNIPVVSQIGAAVSTISGFVSSFF